MHSPRRAFTLLELLVAMSVLAVLMLILMRMFGEVSTLWQTSEKRTDAFREARAALEMMAADLGPTLRQAPMPTLVLDNVFKPSGDDAGLAHNQQVFALASRPNDGSSDVCTVGYYCRWDDARSGYVLMRHFRDSDQTFAAIEAEGLNPQAKFAPDAFYHPGSTKPGEEDEEIAAFVFDLKITPIPHPGADAETYPHIYNQNELPVALDVSCKAISPLAIRPYAGPQMLSDFYFLPSSHIFQNRIAPAMQEFHTRIELVLAR